MTLTLEESTHNIIFTKGLFAIPIEAFQFNWDILNRIFVSTFHKYEKFCPKLKTIQTGGGNPIIMPEDCIYPRSVAFGNQLMIAPQAVATDAQSWTYDRETRRLSVFTNTGSSAPFKVQYLARYSPISVESHIEPFEVYEGETNIEIQLDLVPDLSTLHISKGESTLEVCENSRYCIKFDGQLGTGELDLTNLVLRISQIDTSAGFINISYKGKYKAFDFITDDAEFFETWYAANILNSLGNIRAVVRVDEMPNDINADDLKSQGLELMNRVLEFQKEKQYWFRGFLNARV